MRNARYEMLAKAIREHDFAGCDPYSVAEAYKRDEKTREQIRKLVSTLNGFEHEEFQHAIRVLDCRLAAQYAFVRDRVGLGPLFSPMKKVAS